MEAIKQVWPQWQIRETIGAGQYGRVYRAVREESGVRFTSAIKEINIPNGDAEIRELRSAGLTDQAIENYFEEKKNSVINEIRLMESLKSSDGIVSIEDYGCVKREHAPGWIVYIRMELLESLSHYRTRHQITEQEVLQIGLEISAALMDCARYQIIHRDIKWDNIFRSEFGHYKLGDFGVSRQLEHTSSAGTMIGTATYMAPEIMRMEAYDHRVDLYALGLVLYRLLNGGRFPFVSESPTPAEMELASIRRLRGDALPLPCEADPELGRIINRACAHRKEDRYETAAEFHQALESYRLCVTSAAWKKQKEQPKPTEKEKLPEQNTENARKHMPESTSAGTVETKAAASFVSDADTDGKTMALFGTSGTAPDLAGVQKAAGARKSSAERNTNRQTEAVGQERDTQKKPEAGNPANGASGGKNQAWLEDEITRLQQEQARMRKHRLVWLLVPVVCLLLCSVNPIFAEICGFAVLPAIVGCITCKIKLSRGATRINELQKSIDGAQGNQNGSEQKR